MLYCPVLTLTSSLVTLSFQEIPKMLLCHLYQYLACKYKYKYQYPKIVLKYRSSTSTSTQYNKTAGRVRRRPQPMSYSEKLSDYHFMSYTHYYHPSTASQNYNLRHHAHSLELPAHTTHLT